MTSQIYDECCGITYTQFTVPKNVTISGFDLPKEQTEIKAWMELLTPTTTATVISSYIHPNWGKYAAITKNNFGDGTATYIGCFTTGTLLKAIYTDVLSDIGLYTQQQEYTFPIIIKTGYNMENKTIVYYFNYSANPQTVRHIYEDGMELISDRPIQNGQTIDLNPWDFVIIEC